MALYLHFLDRELLESVSGGVEPDLCVRVLEHILFFTYEPLYSGLSHIAETCVSNPCLMSLSKTLLACQELKVVSAHANMDEFLSTRIPLYSGQESKYPAYFREGIKAAFMEISPPIVPKNVSTTQTLVSQLRNSAASDTPLVHRGPLAEEVIVKRVNQAIVEALDNRGARAVTAALFQPVFLSRSLQAGHAISYKVSELYTYHYMQFLCADIVTGIPRLWTYDKLALHFPRFDFSIMAGLSRIWGLNARGPIIQAVLAKRGSASHIRFVNAYRKLLVIASRVKENRLDITNMVARRNALRGTLLSLPWKLETRDSSTLPEFIVEMLYTELTSEAERLAEIIRKAQPDSRFENETDEEIAGLIRMRILVITSTDIETEVLLTHAHARKVPVLPNLNSRVAHIQLGPVRGAELLLVQTQIGSGGVGGSALTIPDAIEDFSPTFVVAVGIAFGSSEAEQSLGDVLVSRQIQCYDLERIGKYRILPRGEKVSAHPDLVSRCIVAKANWHDSRIHSGLILSGSKLVDNLRFKTALLKRYPDAIGGEMEAAGLIAACQKKSTPWVVIKGICDWGEGKTNHHQKAAAEKAVGLFWHILEQGGWSSFRR